MRRSREIASMRYPSSVLKAVLWGFDKEGIRRHKQEGWGRVGCDLLIPANATVESQSNHDLQVSLI